MKLCRSKSPTVGSEFNSGVEAYAVRSDMRPKPLNPDEVEVSHTRARGSGTPDFSRAARIGKGLGTDRRTVDNIKPVLSHGPASREGPPSGPALSQRG